MVGAGELGRQDGLLHFVGDAQLVLQRHQLVPRLQRLPPFLQVPQRPLDRNHQVVKIQRLGDEIKRPPVHRRANVFHIAVGGDDDRAHIRVDVGNLLQQRQPVHFGHIDVGDHHIDVAVVVEAFQGGDAVLREHQLIASGPDVAPHPLPEQRLHIRLVVHHQNLVRPLRHSAAPAGLRVVGRPAGLAMAMAMTLTATVASAIVAAAARLPTGR